jgi:RNA polymerase sigma-70 factor (ECF subfamily)
MSGGCDDECLIRACRSGDAEAFGALVSRYQGRLYPTVLRLTGSTEDALDLLQEAFLRAYQNLDRFQGESSFYTWIYRIAINLALSDRRRKRRTLRWVDEHRGPDVAELQDRQGTDPAAPVERAERDHRIQEALNTLPPDYRAVLVLKEFDGLAYEEISAVLGIPIGTVRSRIHRARCELRDQLRELVEENPTLPRTFAAYPEDPPPVARHATRGKRP